MVEETENQTQVEREIKDFDAPGILGSELYNNRRTHSVTPFETGTYSGACYLLQHNQVISDRATIVESGVSIGIGVVYFRKGEGDLRQIPPKNILSRSGLEGVSISYEVHSMNDTTLKLEVSRTIPDMRRISDDDRINFEYYLSRGSPKKNLPNLVLKADLEKEQWSIFRK